MVSYPPRLSQMKTLQLADGDNPLRKKLTIEPKPLFFC